MLMRLLVLAASASAATIKIAVGQGGLTYTPDSVKAELGDILEFKFVGGSHDVVRGNYASVCSPSTNATEGFASGVIAGSPTNVSSRSSEATTPSIPVPC